MTASQGRLVPVCFSFAMPPALLWGGEMWESQRHQAAGGRVLPLAVQLGSFLLNCLTLSHTLTFRGAASLSSWEQSQWIWEKRESSHTFQQSLPRCTGS